MKGFAAISTSTKNTPPIVVGIGASAGGLAAFKAFLAHLPADTGMAFVLVQHLAPDHKSLLVELLGAKSPISVVVARDGLAVRENCVFVIPPDATLTIQDGVLRVVSPAPAREHRWPIDSFFTSLAEDCGEHAIGVVLAGVGSDGSMGIRAIKEHGGLTLAQAEFDATALMGMPSSAVATGLVDEVLPVEAMPAKLAAYASHMNGVAKRKDHNGHRPDLQEQLGRITALLHQRSAHDFSGYKGTTLMRRVQRRMQVLHIETAAEYVERLRADPAEIEALFNEFLIGVTQFFRDPEAFEALAAQVVRPMIAAKAADDPIRVWVPGCSTGEEVYSIAILLREALQGRRHPDIKIFGTDIDPGAVATARAGRFRDTARGLSPERLARWFAKYGEEYRPVPEIREMCIFSPHSVVKDPPFSHLDLISCRNVLIYLGEDMQDRVARAFHYALEPEGHLFLGSADGVTRHARLFNARDRTHRIYQRCDVGSHLPTRWPERLPASGLSPTAAADGRGEARGDDRTDKAVERVMRHYAPAYFVIDRHGDVTRFSGAETGHYIEPAQGPATLNLFSILRRTLRPAVRAAVERARAGGQRVTNENLAIRIDGKARLLTLTVEPIVAAIGAPTADPPTSDPPTSGSPTSGPPTSGPPTSGPMGDARARATGGFVVAFRDVSPMTTTRGKAPAAEGTGAHVQAMERELDGTRAQLQAAIDELEMRIAEMKSTTEEFQAVNEELQSSNEELETAKEEMQSINEELQTLNNELHSKNDLLANASSDMQNLLESTAIAVVFLDAQLRIKHFTPALQQLFPVLDTDLGRPIASFVTQLDYDDLRSDVDKVLREGGVVERDVNMKDGAREFLARIRPYRTVNGTFEGVVLTFVDITEQSRLANVVSARIIALFAAVPVAISVHDPAGLIREYNDFAVQLWGPLPRIGEPGVPRLQEAVDGVLRTGVPMANVELVVDHLDGAPVPILLTCAPLTNPDGAVIGAITASVDITEKKLAERHQQLLTQELHHRTGNLLAVVGSIASHTLAADRPVAEARDALLARIGAIARGHALLTETAAKKDFLSDLVRGELDQFSDQVVVGGPPVVLTSAATQGFALIIHELATNAAKHGALSVPGGTVSVTWSLVLDAGDEALLQVRWRERGGPPILHQPARKGFGSILLQNALHTSARPPRFDYAREGLTFELDVALGAITVK